MLDCERAGVADEINLGQRDFGTDLAVDPVIDARQAVQLPGQGLEIDTFGACVGFEYEDHRAAAKRGFLSKFINLAHFIAKARQRMLQCMIKICDIPTTTVAEIVASGVNDAVDCPGTALYDTESIRGDPK